MTSRNNYDFIERYWIPNVKENNNVDSYEILNIDEDSTPDQQNTGKKLCEKHGIEYMQCEKPGMHKNLELAADYFEPKGIKFIVWSHADAWPIQDNFYNSLDGLIKTGNLDSFGTIGFNGLDANMLGTEIFKKLKRRVRKGKRPLGVLARCHLGNGDPWVCGIKTRKTPHPIRKPELYLKPHACSQNTWWISALNIGLFRKHIDTSHKFYFHKSWDDICMQFMLHNVYNLILPTYYIVHRQDLKKTVGIPRSSVRLAYKKVDTYSRLDGFPPENWKKEWGWVFGKPKTFAKVKNRYEGTHIYDFYHHNLKKGPWKVFDIPGSEYSSESHNSH